MPPPVPCIWLPRRKVYDSVSHTTSFYQTLHALDVKTGQDKVAPVRITATSPGNGTGSVGGILTFDPLVEGQRSALLLLKGQVWISWASHCDLGTYHGYVMSFSESNLVRTRSLCGHPNGYEGGFWGGGAGPAADSGGSIYVVTGNGLVRRRHRFRGQRSPPDLAKRHPTNYSERLLHSLGPADPGSKRYRRRLRRRPASPRSARHPPSSPADTGWERRHHRPGESRQHGTLPFGQR